MYDYCEFLDFISIYPWQTQVSAGHLLSGTLGQVYYVYWCVWESVKSEIDLRSMSVAVLGQHVCAV